MPPKRTSRYSAPAHQTRSFLAGDNENDWDDGDRGGNDSAEHDAGSTVELREMEENLKRSMAVDVSCHIPWPYTLELMSNPAFRTHSGSDEYVGRRHCTLRGLDHLRRIPASHQGLICQGLGVGFEREGDDKDWLADFAPSY